MIFIHAGEGWMFYGNHYYLNIRSNATWHNAKLACENIGAHLVTIETEEENTWLTETFVPVWDHAECSSWWHCCSHWIGANDIEQEGRFVWTENNNNVTSYSNWYPGEPDDNSGQHCVDLCRHGFWEDASCNKITSYICEMD
ncbi:CD209 antigen-like protein D [Saccostrea cucullata]|uniref:CD209 antigen-like protein D n=1 Tax=Saccostrea cuccullata TaxID=36930 RepID=UPI002ED1BB17